MTVRRPNFIHASILLACAATSVPAATTILSTDFETDPAISKFFIQNSSTGTPTSTWTTDAADSGTHSLKVADGDWLSWYYPTQAFEYYRITANIQSNGNAGMWGSTGLPQIPYPTTPGWTPVSYVFHDPSDAAVEATFNSASPGPVYVDDVTIAHVSRAEAKASLNAYYATLPAYDFSATVRTHAQDQLPATVAKLRAGQAVNCVMLGDSIVGDSYSSSWEALLDGQYAGKMNVTKSIRSSTGCWYYKDPAILQDYVLKYNPELVIIGGISHDNSGILNDTADIASVIDQIRAYNPSTEILLLTEDAGGNNPFTNPSLANPIDPNGTDWRANLYRLAQDKQTGFLDMTESWADYILGSGQSYDWFLRDPIHDNARGESIIGQTLGTYFAAVPEPGTLSLVALVAAPALLARRRGRGRAV